MKATFLFRLSLVSIVWISSPVTYAQDIDVYFRVISTYSNVNSSADYRWNVNFPGRGTEATCLKGSGGPGWYPQNAVIGPVNVSQADTMISFTLHSFRKRCLNTGSKGNGDDCQYIDQCYCTKIIKVRCADHDDTDEGNDAMGVKFKKVPPGKWGTLDPMVTWDSRYGVQFEVLWTPAPPSAITFSNTDYNVCGGQTYNLTASGAYPVTGDYIWEESTNGGPWQTVPGQNGAILSVTAPSNVQLGTFITKSYRVYCRNNGTGSVRPTVFDKSIFVYAPPPYLVDNSTYLTLTHIKCKSNASGKIKINRVDGAGSYFYSLKGVSANNQNIIMNSLTTYPTFPNNAYNNNGMTGLPAGDYLLSVANYSNGTSQCPTYVNITLTEPEALTMTGAVPKTYEGSFNIRCNGESNGEITLTGAGGVAPYTFYLDNENSFAPPNQSSSDGKFTSLSAGNYYARVVDNNGCSFTYSSLVNLTEPLPFTSAISATNVKCNGANDGYIAFSNTQGGTPPYLYSSDNGATFSFSNVIDSLSPGSYMAMAKDANGCSTPSQSFTIAEPTRLVLTPSDITGVPCFGSYGGSFKVSAIGGMGGYKYAIDNGLFQNSGNFSDVQGGFHWAKIKDANTCLDSQQVLIPQPEQLAVNFEVQQVQCTGFDNGKVIAHITGGIKPYAYQWTSFSDNDSTIENLSPGTYTLSVKDANKCSRNQTVSVTEPANELSAEITRRIDAKCNITCNGAAEVTVSGGTPPYAYVWNDDNTLNTATVSDLCKGKYEVKVSDSRNCIASTSTVIDDSVTFYINIADSVVLCPGTYVTLNAGNPDCSYEWSNGTGIFSREQIIDESTDGSYNLKVIKPDGCYTEKNFKIRTSKNILKAQFLTQGYVALGDTVVFVEVSQPIPDSIQWNFEGSPVLLNSPKDSPMLYFPKEGIYNIQLTAYLGDCIDSISKKVTFFIPPDDTISVDSLGLGLNRITSLNLYPNPNNGEFKVEVGLDQVQAIDFVIYNSQGSPVSQSSEDGEKDYLISFNMPLGRGVYLMMIKSMTDYKTITFIVN